MRWLLDHLPTGVPIDDVRLGTVDSWLIWQLTGGAEHLCEAGNASRTLLYDITALDWNAELLDVFGVPSASLPTAVASDHGFGATSGVPLVADGTPVVAVLADSHAALPARAVPMWEWRRRPTEQGRRSWPRLRTFLPAMHASR